MKKTITILAIILFSNYIFAQAPNWQWANAAGGTYQDQGQDIAVDGNGNSYVLGTFASASITIGATTLANPGSNSFIVKYNSTGTIVWVISNVTGSNFSAIAVDSSGNCYVSGEFTGTSVTYGTTTLTNAGGGQAVFVVKYDTGGNVVWAKSGSFSSTGNNEVNAITIDANGNSYITGHFQSPTLTFGSITINNSGGGPPWMFMVKLDINGVALWGNSAGGSSSIFPRDITVDINGDSYVTGEFSGNTATFGSTTLTNPGGGMFIVKYSTSNTVLWAKYLGGSDFVEGKSIALDGSGNSYVTGVFQCTSLTAGSFTLINGDNTGNTTDVFIVKYNSSGTVVWAKCAGGIGNEEGDGIAMDGSGNIYVTGFFTSVSVTFGSTTLISNDNTGYYQNIFVVKYDASGNVIWAKSNSGQYGAAGYGICADGSSNSYITGLFYSSPITFGGTTLSNVGNTDMFVAKLNALVGLEEHQKGIGFTIAPNPFTSQTTITFSEEQVNVIVKITDILGKEIKAISFTGKQLIIAKAEMKEGIYFVQTIDPKQHIYCRKIVIQ